MSVLDELSKLENDVRSRMTELRPLLDEYAELEAVARRLNLTDVDAEKSPSRRAGTGRRSTSKSRRAASSKKSDVAKAPETASETKEEAAPKAASARARAKSSSTAKSNPASGGAAKKSRKPGGPRSGQRAEQLAALVQKRPGVTVAQAGAEFGVHPTTLYKVVKQLESDGKLSKRGRELHPA